MAVSLEQFLDRLEASGLHSAETVPGQLEQLPAEVRPQTGLELAKWLTKQKQLTRYQAECILTGTQQSLILGNYLVLEKLGQGGMGVVLKAEHRRMERIVALKVLSPAVTKTPTALQRFQREVKAAAGSGPAPGTIIWVSASPWCHLSNP